MSSEEIKVGEAKVDSVASTSREAEVAKPFNLSEEIDALVKEKVELERKKIKEEILAAERQLKEAQANEVFENEFKTNTRLQTREATINRITNELIEAIEDLNILVDEGRYFKSIFESTEPRYHQIRKFCYAARTLGPEFMVQRLKDNLYKMKFGV